MITVSETTSTVASAEQALMPGVSALPQHPSTTGTLASLADEFTTVDQEIHAARRQMVRGLQETVEGWVRLASALTRMRNSRLYLARGYPSFAAYLERCHDLSEDTALRLVQSLESLGHETVCDLLMNVGAQRTYYLSQIQRLAPPVFEELLALPLVAGQPAVATMETAELAQIVSNLKAQLEAAYTEQAELTDQLAAEQQLGKSITARLADIERVNQQLVTARDKAEREVDHLKEQHTRVQTGALKQIRDAERQNRELRQQLEDARTAVRVSAPVSRETEIVQEVVAYDSALLVDLVRTCVASLHRYRELAHEPTPEQLRDLYMAIGDLIASGDTVFLITAIRACATALRRYPDAAAVPSDAAPELYAALNDFGPAAVALYPQEELNGSPR